MMNRLASHLRSRSPRRVALLAGATAVALLGPAAPATADTQVFHDEVFRAFVIIDSTVDRPFGGSCIRNQRVSAAVGEVDSFVSYSDYSECEGDGRLIYGGGVAGPAEGLEVDFHPNLRTARLVATFPVFDEFSGGAAVGTVTVDLTLQGTGKVERTTTRHTSEVPGEGGTVQVTKQRTTEKTRSTTMSGVIDADHVDWPTLTSTTSAELRSVEVRQVIRTS